MRPLALGNPRLRTRSRRQVATTRAPSARPRPSVNLAHTGPPGSPEPATWRTPPASATQPRYRAPEPLGAQGQGIGDVSDIWSWAQSAGRAIPNGPGAGPKPGDLIVFGGEQV